MSEKITLPGGYEVTEEDIRLADEQFPVFVLTNGMIDGDPFWAYLAIPPSKLPAYKEAQKKQTINLSDYGTIIKAGEGSEPPEEVQREMEEQYGMNHNFEEELAQLIKDYEEYHQEEEQKKELVDKYAGKKSPSPDTAEE